MKAHSENAVIAVNPDGSKTLLYDPTEKALDYHARIEPNVLMYGNRGGGKSTIMRWDCHFRAMSNPNFRYCILRRTFPELQKSHLVHIHKEMKLLGGYYNSSEKRAYYPNGAQGDFSQCDGEEHVLKLLSAEYTLMAFDELSTFTWEHFIKLSFSVRVSEGSGLIAMVRASTNPLGPSAQEVYQYFINKDVDLVDDPDYDPANWHAIRIDMQDNPYLDVKQYSKRFAGLPPHVRKAWIDGEFALENALFEFYPDRLVDREGQKIKIPYHVISYFDPKILKAATIYRAMDAGWFPDPTICLWIAHLGKRHIVFHEMLWYKTTAADIAAEIKQIDESLGVTKVAITYCDPTMDVHTTADIRSVKEIYEANGIPMECSINNREYFAITMHNALATEPEPDVPSVQFYQVGCPYTIKTLPMMRFNPKHPEKMDDHKHDHGVVTCCYYLMSHASDPRMVIPSSPTAKRWLQTKSEPRWTLGAENSRSPY